MDLSEIKLKFTIELPDTATSTERKDWALAGDVYNELQDYLLPAIESIISECVPTDKKAVLSRQIKNGNFTGEDVARWIDTLNDLVQSRPNLPEMPRIDQKQKKH